MRRRGRFPGSRRRAMPPGIAAFACLLLFGCAGGAADGPGEAPVGDSRQAAADPPAPLVLVSMDGFRADYPDIAETPHLDRLIGSGVRADGIVPAFPSKTFPGHYTIVTGLYAGHHGIVSNNMRDPGWPEVFGLGARDQVQNGRWWGGEPIWVTANLQGLRSAGYFWPGSEAEIRGVRPDHWRVFDAAVPAAARVDQVLAWFDLPAAERPSFVALYFNDPNDTSHRYGATAPETLAAIRGVDAALGRLLDGLERRGNLASTNIVVVSDHGMADVSSERVIDLDALADLRDSEVFEQGAFVQIFPETADREAELYEVLRSAHPRLAIYRPDEIPDRFHLYAHPRLAPIIGIPDVGWEALTRDRESIWTNLRGDHGQDPEHPEMQGIFVAAGPAFASGVRVPTFEAVEIYNLLAAALGLEPADNDGDLDRVPGILRDASAASTGSSR